MRSIKFFSVALWVTGLVSTPSVAHAQGKVIGSNDEWFTQALASTRADDRQLLLQNALDWFGLFAHNSVESYPDHDVRADAGFTSVLTSPELNPVITSTESESGLSNYAAVGAPYNNVFANAFGAGYARFFQGIAGHVPTSTFAGQQVYGAALFHDVSSIFVNNGNGVVYSRSVAGVTSEAFSTGDHGLNGLAQVTATPEPASLALIATGLVALIPVIRRRRRQG